MKALREFLYRFLRWLYFPGPLIKADPPPPDPPQFFLTGESLIMRIVRAIELNQSVVLSGPRGCGKSFCAGAAIKRAKELGVVPQGDHPFLQGNREIPRDYLIEDEIAFRTHVDEAGNIEVVPYRRSSPLFTFAVRDKATGEPVLENRDDPSSRRVRCEINGLVCNKFVLFLDEINRFSDGVLDGLLSVLEERRATLAGQSFELPVVVVMTMNPPGYDGSARKLSPPLAARIGRTYRLCTADLDTLGDEIITAKINTLRKTYNANRTTDQPEFPDVPMKIIRKVGLVTLCMWGDVRGQKAGTEYLTPQTQKQLREVMANDSEARAAMVDLTGLCQFGPDGRAGSDWLTTAIGLAIEEATRSRSPRAVLRPEHLIETVIESVAHKIYDSFSQASRPDLTARKERAVTIICRQIMARPFFDRFVDRIVDNAHQLWAPFQGRLHVSEEELQSAFIRSGVVSDNVVALWQQVAREFQPGVLRQLLQQRGFLEPEDKEQQLKEGFNHPTFDSLGQRLEQMPGPLGNEMKSLRIQLGPTRVPLAEEIGSSFPIRCVGVDTFLRIARKNNVTERSQVRDVTRDIESIWSYAYRTQPAKHLFKVEGQRTPPAEVLDRLEARFKTSIQILPYLRSAAASVRESEADEYARFLSQVRTRLRRLIRDIKRARQLQGGIG